MDLWVESWIFEIGNGLWKKNPTLEMVKGVAHSVCLDTRFPSTFAFCVCIFFFFFHALWQNAVTVQ